MDTGPYLRMALNEQVASRDSVMSSGRAPDGALTVAAEALSKDDEAPKGFYLRLVDGQAWLRGYRCDESTRGPPMTGSSFSFRRSRPLEVSPALAYRDENDCDATTPNQ